MEQETCPHCKEQEKVEKRFKRFRKVMRVIAKSSPPERAAFLLEVMMFHNLLIFDPETKTLKSVDARSMCLNGDAIQFTLE